MIYDQFGEPIRPRRVFGFVPPPAPVPAEETEPCADAIASQTIYPEEVSEL